MNLVIALPKEAAPLIESWSLKNIQHTPFPLYTANNRHLIISGMGGENAAKATQYLIDHSPRKNQPWLNLGIAGHGSLARGKIFSVGRVISQGKPEVFYPPKIISSPIPVSELTSCVEPVSTYQKNMGFDMEAHAFYRTASTASTRELVQVLKIVSDNPEFPICEFKPAMATQWIRENLSIIDDWVSKLEEMAKEIMPCLEVKKHLDRMTKKGGFSATRKIQLSTLLQQSDALGINLDDVEMVFEAASTPKLAIQAVENFLYQKRVLP